MRRPWPEHLAGWSQVTGVSGQVPKCRLPVSAVSALPCPCFPPAPGTGCAITGGVKLAAATDRVGRGEAAMEPGCEPGPAQVAEFCPLTSPALNPVGIRPWWGGLRAGARGSVPTSLSLMCCQCSHPDYISLSGSQGRSGTCHSGSRPGDRVCAWSPKTCVQGWLCHGLDQVSHFTRLVTGGLRG